jgi:hypothetical protein
MIYPGAVVLKQLDIGWSFLKKQANGDQGLRLPVGRQGMRNANVIKKQQRAWSMAPV